MKILNRNPYFSESSPCVIQFTKSLVQKQKAWFSGKLFQRKMPQDACAQLMSGSPQEGEELLLIKEMLNKDDQ